MIDLGILLSRSASPGAAGCGCVAPTRSPPPRVGVLALLLRKAGSRKRIAARETRVSKYVTAREGATRARIAKVFTHWAPRLAARIAASLRKADFTHRLLKAKRPKDPRALAAEVIRELDLGEFNVELVEALSADLVKAFGAGGGTGLELIGLADDRRLVNLVSDEAVAFAERHGAELVTELEETTRDALRIAVTSALEDGLTTADFADLIEGDSAFSADRAEMIARTELATAHVQGSLTAWYESGVVSGKQSLLADTHPVPDECDDNAEAGVIDLDEDFPSGDAGPPYHPFCLCDVAPVVSGEEE